MLLESWDVGLGIKMIKRNDDWKFSKLDENYKLKIQETEWTSTKIVTRKPEPDISQCNCWKQEIKKKKNPKLQSGKNRHTVSRRTIRMTVNFSLETWEKQQNDLFKSRQKKRKG